MPFRGLHFLGSFNVKRTTNEYIKDINFSLYNVMKLKIDVIREVNHPN